MAPGEPILPWRANYGISHLRRADFFTGIARLCFRCPSCNVRKALRKLRNVPALVPFLGANVSPHSLQPLDQGWVTVVEGAVPRVGILRKAAATCKTQQWGMRHLTKVPTEPESAREIERCRAHL